MYPLNFTMKRTPSILSGIAAVIGLSLLTSPLPAQNDAAPAAPAPETKAAEAPVVKPEAASEAPAAEAPALAETDVVLSVDGTEITVRDVRELFTARYGRQFEQMPAEQRAMIEPQIQQMVMNELISKTLLLNASDREGFKATDEEIKKSMDEIAASIPDGVPIEEFAASAGVSLDRIRNQVAEDTKVRKLYEKVTSEVTAPAEAEVKKYFEEHPEEFEQKASVDAAHILISTQGITEPAALAQKEKIAKELREELVLKKGENFAEMAGLHSECPSKAQGGDLGEFEKGQMVPEFETAAFAQEVGAIGECVKTDFGYHIIKVNSRKEAKTLAYDEVKEKLTEDMLQQAKSTKMEGYVKGLRESAKIEQPGAAAASPEAPAEGEDAPKAEKADSEKPL